jgi:hypothetical protein
VTFILIVPPYKSFALLDWRLNKKLECEPTHNAAAFAWLVLGQLLHAFLNMFFPGSPRKSAAMPVLAAFEPTVDSGYT